MFVNLKLKKKKTDSILRRTSRRLHSSNGYPTHVGEFHTATTTGVTHGFN